MRMAHFAAENYSQDETYAERVRYESTWTIKFKQSRQQHSTSFRSLEKLREVKKEAVAAGHKIMFTMAVNPPKPTAIETLPAI